MGLFSSPKITPPPPAPPPPNPPMLADSTVAQSGAAARQAAAAASGMGFAGTLLTGAQGALQPQTATKQLLGQ